MGKYEHFWEEDPTKTQLEKEYCQGHDDGYAQALEDYRPAYWRQKAESLESLLSANVRVIKQELKEELEEEAAKAAT